MPHRPIVALALVLAFAPAVFAQAWEPMGPLPVDQAGAGRRGYVIASDSAKVVPPGASRIALHAVAANNFFREETDAFLITQRYEVHTLGIAVRHGFGTKRMPLEAGVQIQLHESGAGMLNGFVAGVENLWSSLTDRAAANVRKREAGSALPFGTVVVRNGRPMYLAPGAAAGVGDLSLVLKAQLRGVESGGRGPRLAARAGANLSGAQAFTQGNFAGAGLSVEQRIGRRAALHGDARVAVLFDRISSWGLPLRRATVAFSVGPEIGIAGQTSLSAQIDGSTTPYVAAGASAFDEAYGAVTLGLSHRFGRGPRHLIVRGYARENMMLPLRIRMNSDPDLAVGIEATITAP
ncbi:MAG: hypothetical protein IT176_06705 [Acidobacteria bacterium]|nr:hypothetical protein [Acidobacteriota bacterium]